MLIWRVIRNWKKNMCLIRGTWRRKEKKDVLTNKMLQQQRKLSKQQTTVHWRIFGLSWSFFVQSVSCPAWQENERKTGQLMMQLKTWICLLQFALIGFCYYPKSLWKKNWLHSFWILFSLDLWCSNRFNYTYYSSNCPNDMMSDLWIKYSLPTK